MKKILSNRMLQITCLTIFVAIIGILVYTSTGTVKADDNVDMKIYNERNKEVDTIINELTDKITMLEQKTETIETLQKDLDKANEKIKSLENEITENKGDIKETTTRVGKIEARENYLYETGENGRLPSLYTISKYINENLK